MRPAALALFGAMLIAASAPQWRWALPSDRAPPPVPADNPMSAAKVELGRRLFYDADLSIDGTMSCATCHEQHRGFTDSNRTRPGVHGDPGRRNISALANVAWRGSLTWADPTTTTLERQAATPIAGDRPIEMGMKGSEAELGKRLGRDACYRRMFARAFPGDRPGDRGRIDMTIISKALAAFQRTLVSADAPYDRWRRGDPAAMPSGAIAGETLFRARCAACHAGPDFTDDAFHRVDRGAPSRSDLGLREITGDPADEGRFRTAGLRNVAVSGPYFHDGAAPTLPDAIRRHRDIDLAELEVSALVAFLDQLTDRTFLTDKRFAHPDRACGKAL